MYSPRSLLEKGTTRELRKRSLEVPDASLADAPGNRKMDRFGHDRSDLQWAAFLGTTCGFWAD